MDTRDYVIIAIITGLIVWFFCARKKGCGCNTPARVIGNQGSTAKCGPFACGGKENLRAPMAQPLRRI